MLGSDDLILLIRHLISSGADEADIVRCLDELGIRPHKTLFILELLIMLKEVRRDETNRLHLVRQTTIPKYIREIARTSKCFPHE